MSNIDAEELVVSLDLWTKLIEANAHILAKALLSNDLGPIVVLPDVELINGETTYGVRCEALSSTVHSN